jgi:hypothetical protein
MRRAAAIVIALAVAIPGAIPAGAATRPVVLELFTSQSCSSCPPADALLASIAASRDDVLALDYHVDYWNYLRWKDRFSLPAATARQRTYAGLLGTEVYTPQLIIDGRSQAVGSEQAAVAGAIAAARAALTTGPSLTIARDKGDLCIAIGAADGIAQVLVVSFDGAHVTVVGDGENSGRTLREVNVVRSIYAIGSWHGSAANLRVAQPVGDHVAVLLQAADGKIVAADSI